MAMAMALAMALALALAMAMAMAGKLIFNEYEMGQTSKICSNNTSVQKFDNGDFRVVLHSTEIVRKAGNTINTGGYNTATTRARINQVANELCSSTFGVYTKKGQLYCRLPHAGTRYRMSEHSPVLYLGDDHKGDAMFCTQIIFDLL
jgi:hypothetical protein